MAKSGPCFCCRAELYTFASSLREIFKAAAGWVLSGWRGFAVVTTLAVAAPMPLPMARPGALGQDHTFGGFSFRNYNLSGNGMAASRS